MKTHNFKQWISAKERRRKDKNKDKDKQKKND